MGGYPWALIIGGELLVIGLVFMGIGAGIASLIWWLL